MKQRAVKNKPEPKKKVDIEPGKRVEEIIVIKKKDKSLYRQLFLC